MAGRKLLWTTLGLLAFYFSATLQGVVTEQEVSRVRRIIGGVDAKLDEYPWVVSLRARKENSIEAAFFGGRESYCGGTLISKRWILTAAHCIFTNDKKGNSVNFKNPSNWHIRMERENLRPGFAETIKNIFNRILNFMGEKKKQTYYHASEVLPHPDYIPGILENDIALIRIKEKLDFRGLEHRAVLPIPAPKTGQAWPLEGQSCVVLGWGCNRANGPPEDKVQKLIVPVISGNQCRQIYVSSINLTDSKEFCAGYQRGASGICPGDSGGPLACDLDGRLHVAGIVSATHSKNPESYPGLFTRVSYYSEWIRSVIERE